MGSNPNEGKLIHTYYATAVLSWTGGPTIEFKSRGVDGIGTPVASDSVEWTFSKQNGGDPKLTYYSSLENPYAEIKNRTPGGEYYEAMAGVPTTEDMYVGFGATEFKTNVDITYRMDSNGDKKRVYTITYTAEQCYDHETACTWTCEGHEYSHTYYDGCNGGEPGGSCPGHTCSGKLYCNTATGDSKTGDCGGSHEQASSGLQSCAYTKEDGTSGTYTGYGCKATHHQEDGDRNPAHPTTQKFTVVVEQPIDDFYYLDITKLDLWQVENVEYSPADKIWGTNLYKKYVDKK